MRIPPELAKINVLTTLLQSNSEHIKCLRQLKHLVTVEVDLTEEKDYKPPEGVLEKTREAWKRELTSLLKDIPSTDRKILRWKLVQSYHRPRRDGGSKRVYDVMETEELEVFSDISL